MPTGAQLNAALRGRTGELPSIPSPEYRVPYIELKIDRSKTRLTSGSVWTGYAGSRSNDEVSIG
jgi:hypothetical protein